MKYITYFLAIMLGSTSYISALKPNFEYSITPDSLDMNIDWKEMDIKMNEEQYLKSWILYPSQSSDLQKAIIICNTDTGNMSDNVLLAANLSQAGYTAILFDYRGFGYSSPFYIDESFLYLDEFTQDLQHIFKHTQQLFPKHSIGILGISMGSIISQISIYQELIKPAFLIYDGLITNPSQFKNKRFTLDKKHLSLPTSAFTYVKEIDKIKIPMLIFASQDDTLIPLSSIQQYAKKPRKARIITYSRGHALAFNPTTSTTIWLDAINDFSSHN